MRAFRRGLVSLSALCQLCLALALSWLASASANATDAAYGQVPAQAQATQNPPKSDTSGETPAKAQPLTTKPKAEPQPLEELIVTGSRIPVAANEGPQNVKIYRRDDIDQSGTTTLAEFLNTLPDASLGINENGNQTLAGTTTVQLHGLPIGTTLVLLNGRRVNTSGATQPYGKTYFDLNTIPLAAIDRIELVSQGSSAVYGSDAIAGVVNVILKKGFDGFEANSKYGSADEHHELGADLAWGRRWDSGSLGVIGTYLTRTELPRYDRTLTNDNNYVAYGGSNANLYMCPNQANVYSLNGGNLPSLGAPYAAVPAGYTGVPSLEEFAPTAGTLNRCSLFRYNSAILGTERGSVMLDGSFELTQSAELYSNVLLSHVQQYGYLNPLILFGQPGFQQFSVGAANPYNPFGQAVGVSDMLSDLPRGVSDLRTNYLDAVVGFRGRLFDSWRWDVGISDSEDHTRYLQTDSNPSALQAALNSSDPATALNPFVNASPASLAIQQSGVAQDVIESLGRATVVDATLRGALVDLPSGALQAAFGGQYERDTLYQNEAFFSGPVNVTDFHRKIYALFAEGKIPLIGPASGSRSGDRLAVTLAGRFDHYNDFGGKWTPQFGVEMRPLEPLLVRASYARAFRAPDLVDLHAAQVTVQGAVMDPLRGNTLEEVTLTGGGNPALGPETGLSRTVGILYSSQVHPELRFSVTYWNIEQADGIQRLPAQVIVDNESSFPGAVTRATSCQGAPPCPITAVNVSYLNFGSVNAAGFDYQASYRQQTDLGTFTPSIAVTQTYRYEATLTPASPAVDGVSAAQDTGNWAPRWKGSLALDWHGGNWNAYLVGRYVSRYVDYDSTRTIGNFWLVDANLRYALGQLIAPASPYWENLYMRVGGVNLFNRLPQFSNYQQSFNGYDPTQADIRGRFLYGQLGVHW